MDDNDESYRLYDNKERAFVNQKQYKSRESATRSAEQRNQDYGSHRYSAEKYSDIVSRNTPKGGGGGGGGGFGTVRSPIDKLPLMAKGGKVSVSKRADGCAQRGRTRGRMV